MGRFRLPVREETQRYIKRHLSELYRKTADVRNTNSKARAELQGTHKTPVKMVMKLDPGILWILCTEGCVWRALLSIYNDPEVFNDSHRSWCCLRCAMSKGRRPESGRFQCYGIRLQAPWLPHMPRINDEPNPAEKDTTRSRKAKQQWSEWVDLKSDVLRGAIYLWQDSVWDRIRGRLPKQMVPAMIMSERTIESLIQVAQMINLSRAAFGSGLRKAGIDTDCSPYN